MKIKESQLRKLIKENIIQILNEKAVSKSQQRFMGMVHAVQKGELDADEVGDSVAKAAKSMKKKDVKDFAETKHKGLPNHVDEAKLREMIKEAIQELSIDTERSFLDKTNQMGRSIQHRKGLINIINKYNKLYAFNEPLGEPGYIFKAQLLVNKNLYVVCTEPASKKAYQIHFGTDGKRYILDGEGYQIIPSGDTLISYFIDNLKAAQRQKFNNLIAISKKLNGVEV